MKQFAKCYCRSYQFCLKTAIPMLPYHEPEILNSISLLPGILKEKGIRSLLLITDAGIRSHGLTRSLEEGLRKQEISCTVYDKTVANPTSANVEEARALYLRDHCEAIIGFGGGSSIDCAKGVGARIARPRLPLSKMEGSLGLAIRAPTPLAQSMEEPPPKPIIASQWSRR